MRKSEITPELIALSKKAKKLGFPQDVKEGDWICIVNLDGKQLVLVTKKHLSSFFIDDQLHWFLILSFDICLAWLREKFGTTEILLNFPKKGGCEIQFDDSGEGMHGFEAKTRHEAIAKAVVKVLEGNKG